MTFLPSDLFQGNPIKYIYINFFNNSFKKKGFYWACLYNPYSKSQVHVVRTALGSHRPDSLLLQGPIGQPFQAQKSYYRDLHPNLLVPQWEDYKTEPPTIVWAAGIKPWILRMWCCDTAHELNAPMLIYVHISTPWSKSTHLSDHLCKLYFN